MKIVIELLHFSKKTDILKKIIGVLHLLMCWARQSACTRVKQVLYGIQVNVAKEELCYIELQ